MRHRSLIVALLSTVFAWIVTILNSCAVSIPNPTDSELASLPREFARYTVKELREGREVYIASCGGCHRLYTPGEKTPAEWREVVTAMRKKSSLHGPEEEKLLAYLQAFAKPLTTLEP